MRRLSPVAAALALATALVAATACGDAGSGTSPDAAAPAPSLAFVSPAPGAAFTRDDLGALGALVARVPVELAVEGAPARVALALADRELASGAPAGQATLALDAELGAAGPATLVATAYDAAGAEVARAEVAVTVDEPAPADCHGWLDLYHVAYTVGPDRPGVTDPVTATLPINGLPYAYAGTPRTTMFGDCTLIRSLAEAAPVLRARGIVKVSDLGVYNYRCINNAGTPPNCTQGLSQHAFGNAIDLAAFEDDAGQTYTVETDWVIDPDPEKTCLAATEPGKDAFLHQLICELKDRHTWNIVLTPNYNALHRDHFHVDLTAGSDFINRLAATGVDPRAPGVVLGAH